MLISVVIPAFNEEENITACLEALANQTLARQEFEVIVVDNGSTDQTFRMASKFKKRLPLRILSQPRTSISAARNRGASIAVSGMLAFLDADCMTRPDWLQKAILVAQRRTLWGAHYLVQKDASWVGLTWFRFQATEEEGHVSFIPGSCLFVHRTDFEELGGFDESMVTSEDVDLSLRAKWRGFAVVAHPPLAVYHEGTPRTLAGFFRQNRWHGRNVLPNFIANLPSTKNLGIVALTLFTFSMAGLTLIALAAGFFWHHWAISAVPVALLLLPPAMLSIFKTIQARDFAAAPALFLLYLVYLLARAASLRCSFFSRNHVKSITGWRQTQRAIEPSRPSRPAAGSSRSGRIALGRSKTAVSYVRSISSRVR